MRKSDFEGLLRRALGLIDQAMKAAKTIRGVKTKDFIAALQYVKDDIAIALERLDNMR